METELAALLAGEHRDPHAYLGLHPAGDGWIIRVRRPEARKVAVVSDGAIRTMTRIHDEGVFELAIDTVPDGGYRLEIHDEDRGRSNVGDPYRFGPTLGAVDLHLIGEGTHRRLWEALGARRIEHEGVWGTAFSVWAPNARSVRVVGDHNDWDGRCQPMRELDGSGVWELFVPLLEPGARYKFEVIGADGRLVLKADPLARHAELTPLTASIVDRSDHVWHDAEWLQRRAVRRFDDRLSIYEVHLGSWRRVPEDEHRMLTYDELATQLGDYVSDLGFTHVQLLPVAEHPFGGSWGYQVTGYYAPTARHGDPDGLRRLVDTLHQRGIGVLLDWVPAHFPRDDHGLARFDGTALYEHDDPRQGEHPDWGTLVFNYGRNEVANFLIANALYWFEEFHIDGLRVDAVASMLYLDYSRDSGRWVPNDHGGRENLEAIAFVQGCNTVVHDEHPGVMMIAEESTSFDGVTRPVHDDGLGFTQKWNMGWMHDTLRYFGQDPVHRSHEHDLLTFGLVYAWSENFVLPLSHDEVVHGKRSLLEKMPGDRWQRFANLRALLAWMWAHPGKQLTFMGTEIAPWREWDHDQSLDWHLLAETDHHGIHELVRELNDVQARTPALTTADFEPGGFTWLDAADRDHSAFSFLRRGNGAAPVVCVANLTPVPRHGYRVGLPVSGDWQELLNTDETAFGGSGIANQDIVAESLAWQRQSQSTVLTLPPLAVLWLTPAL